jgi:D-tyrosyl-tRNA(Tyr) deacylase
VRAVVQRVSRASVAVDQQAVASIGTGLLVLLGVATEDTEADARQLADKVAHLRVFTDGTGQMNRSVLEAGGAALVVSQFTLLGDCRRGRRPSYVAAASPADAERLYATFVSALRLHVRDVQEGVFRAMMDVSLVNAGPVTLLLDSRKLF